MKRNRVNNKEKAQGMVEFALVLPILLLVIMGIFAFGHLFFSYTMVVAASREAARYGAAAGGISGGTVSGGYRDCAGIRSTAQRVGGAAGVTTGGSIGYEGSDPGIYIGYDSGPKDLTPNATCDVGSSGPATITLGDRILVRVTVLYQPIVPFVNLPSFPLSATTARTIIKDVSVSDALPGSLDCKTTTPVVEFHIDDPSLGSDPPAATQAFANQIIYPWVKITVSDGTAPGGQMYITALGANSIEGCGPIGVNNDLFYKDCKITFDTPGRYAFKVDYISNNTVTQCHAETNNDQIDVVADNTETKIVEPADGTTSMQNEPLTVTAQVSNSSLSSLSRANLDSGKGVPSGTVEIRTNPDLTSTPACTIAVDGTVQVSDVDGKPTAQASCDITGLAVGNHTIYANYVPDSPAYNPSTAVSIQHEVLKPPAVVTGVAVELSQKSIMEGSQSVTAKLTVGPGSPSGLIDVGVKTDGGVITGIGCDDLGISNGSVAYCELNGEWISGDSPYIITAYFTSSDSSDYLDSSGSASLTVEKSVEIILYPPPNP